MGKSGPPSESLQVKQKEHHSPINARLTAHPQHEPTTTVCDELLKKHPLCQPAHPIALISSTTPRPVVHPVVFDCLDGASICSAAFRTSECAVLSALDSAGWRRLWTSFHNASADLRNSLASVARKLCTTYVDPPLTASRLDKCPGVRPIGFEKTPGGVLVRPSWQSSSTTFLKLQLLSNSYHEAACGAAMKTQKPY